MTSLSLFALASVVPKDHGDAPQTGNTHQCVDNAADGTHLAAKEKCHAVEAEEAYAARVKSDVTAAITVLCEQLGEQHKPFFVYPYGETSDVLVSAVKNAGFSAAFAKGNDGCIRGDSDRYNLGRMSVTQSMSKSKFKDLVN